MKKEKSTTRMTEYILDQAKHSDYRKAGCREAMRDLWRLSSDPASPQHAVHPGEPQSWLQASRNELGRTACTSRRGLGHTLERRERGNGGLEGAVSCGGKRRWYCC